MDVQHLSEQTGQTDLRRSGTLFCKFYVLLLCDLLPSLVLFTPSPPRFPRSPPTTRGPRAELTVMSNCGNGQLFHRVGSESGKETQLRAASSLGPAKAQLVGSNGNTDLFDKGVLGTDFNRIQEARNNHGTSKPKRSTWCLQPQLGSMGSMGSSLQEQKWCCWGIHMVIRSHSVVVVGLGSFVCFALDNTHRRFSVSL